ncbi:hypothetical protein AYO24_07765 [Coxiella burnetii]|nr:hypothetical protein COXBURSA331_A1665 [Coxiella burnetii RSA 331]ATN82516.1 hypothetical protein AYO24_07765 [Coxiella burnetii]ATN84421.1 hypothetical protein AYO23_07775 [Coxiella burnetii]
MVKDKNLKPVIPHPSPSRPLVIPAQAGIQRTCAQRTEGAPSSRLRGNDEMAVTCG